MRDFDWNIIVTLYQTRSITQTAKLLFISQPSLSRRIQAIEDELGVNLVMRNKRGTQFTEQGEHIAQKAKEIVSAIQMLHDNIDEYNSGMAGTLRLGAPHSYVRFVLPTLMRKFTDRYQNVSVDIVMELSDELVRQVEENTLDLCFARYSSFDSGLERLLISQERIYAVYDRPFTIQQLPELPLIDFPKNMALTGALERWWSEQFNLPRRVHLRVNNGDSCRSMIRHHLGYGFFSDEKYFSDYPDLYALPLHFRDGSPFLRKTWLVYKKSILSNAVAANFIDFISSGSIQQLLQSRPEP